LERGSSEKTSKANRRKRKAQYAGRKGKREKLEEVKLLREKALRKKRTSRGRASPICLCYGERRRGSGKGGKSKGYKFGLQRKSDVKGKEAGKRSRGKKKSRAGKITWNLCLEKVKVRKRRDEQAGSPTKKQTSAAT